ncbi:MAG: TraB/GumN family protein, partial [Pseudomonadota bacterium]
PAIAACEGRDLIAAMSEEDRAALEAKAAEVTNGDSRFWRVEAPNGAVGHLFGTYHDTQAIETLTPPVRDAFDKAEGSASRRASIAATCDSVSSTTNPSALSKASRTGGVRVSSPTTSMSLALASLLEPWLLFSMLGTPACQLSEMRTGAPVLDRFLSEQASARDIDVVGLETYEAALGAFDAISPAEADGLMRDMFVLAAHDEDIRRTMMTQYAEGRTGMISAFSTAAPEIIGVARKGAPLGSEALGDAFSEAILEKRNLAWIPGLTEALSLPARFVAVGALHLPGEEGLVALLRAQGFTVTAVAE